MSEKRKKPFYKKWWFWVLVVIVVFGVFGSLGNKGDDGQAKPSKDNLTDEIKKAADPHFGKVTKIEINDDLGKNDGGKIVLVHVKQDGLTKRTVDYNTTNALKKVFKIDKVNEITYFWEATVESNSGDSVETVDKIQMSKKSAQKIDWDNFSYTNLEQVADSYHASPILK